MRAKKTLRTVKKGTGRKAISKSKKGASMAARSVSSPLRNGVAVHVRHLIIWSALSVFFFAVLVIVAQYSPALSPEQFIPTQLSQVSSLTAQKIADIMDSQDRDESITIIATGDIMLGRYVERKMRANKDYTLPFHNVSEFLKDADITFGNLETPLVPGKNVVDDSMFFRADVQGVEGLAMSGFDVVSLANNHMMNFKAAGLKSTLESLGNAGIRGVGAGSSNDEAHTPAIITVRGKKVAFYAYNDRSIPPKKHGEANSDTPGIAAMDIDAVKSDVKNALDPKWHGADFVIVSMHAGTEYAKEPTQFQKDFAHAAIDAGASAVIGHHPHVVQPVERYNGGVIFYSLGNFVFDQFFNEEVKTGLVAKITLGGKELEYKLFPAYRDLIAPKIVTDEDEELLSKMGL